MLKKPFILFIEGSDSVGKDYFIDNLTKILVKSNITYKVTSIKPFISEKLRSKLSNKNISAIKTDEAVQILMANDDYIDYVTGLTNISDIEVIILNRTIISYIIYQLHCSEWILEELNKRILFLPKLNDNKRQVTVNNLNVSAYNALHPEILEDVLYKYNRLVNKFNHLFVHLVHRAYGNIDYYNFALNFTAQTFVKRGLSSFDFNTILRVNQLYNEKFGFIVCEKFPNAKSITLTSDYYQYVADEILTSFKENSQND